MTLPSESTTLTTEDPTGSQRRSRAPRSRRAARRRPAVGAIAVLAIALLQTWSLFDYRGDRVDESELVHYAVGFLGGDLDPGWYGYGSLGMYLLFAVFAILAVPAIVLGPLDSVADYAQLLFSSGYFYVVARLAFAVVGVLSVALYADVARRVARVSPVLVAAYAFVALTSVDAIFYANYLRSDRLVSFFVALTLWSSVRSRHVRYLYLCSVAVAAAIAAKASALPLSVFVAGLVALRWHRRDATAEQATLSLLLCGLALTVFQPFVSYPERIAGLFARGTQAPFRWSGAYYESVPERVGSIVGMVAADVTIPVLLLVAGLAVAGAHRRALLPALALLACLTLPYLGSPELRPYWFLPVIDLVRFLALLGAAGLWHLSARGERLPSALRARPGLRRALGVGLALALAAPGLASYAIILRGMASTPASNTQLAQSWLESEVLGKERIALDDQFSYQLPVVYDPQALHESKVISRAFIFDRWDHEYLNAIFARYLVREYGPRHGLGETFGALRGLRLDLLAERGDRLELAGLRLCDRHDDCRSVTELPRSNDIVVERLEGGDLIARVTGGDPYLLLFDDLAVPLDGSHTLEFTAVQPVPARGSLYLDMGRGFSEQLKANFRGGPDLSVPLQAAGPPTDRALVGRLAASRVAEEGFPERDHGAYFVTAPAIYDVFLRTSGDGQPPDRRATLRRNQAGYRKLLDQPLVRRFSAGSGQPIEIYRIDG